MRERKWRWRQDLPPSTVEDYAEVAELTSHVLLLLHETVPYGGLMPDLAWNRTFNLPYWDFIDPVGLRDSEAEKFLGDGCLLLVLTRALDVLDGQGGGLDLSQVSSAIAGTVRRDDDSRRLHHLVQEAILSAVTGRGSLQPDDGRWAFDTFVAGYFHAVASQLDRGG